jgi:hypothetical protein
MKLEHVLSEFLKFLLIPTNVLSYSRVQSTLLLTYTPELYTAFTHAQVCVHEAKSDCSHTDEMLTKMFLPMSKEISR